jgi:hypothetical protein
VIDFLNDCKILYDAFDSEVNFDKFLDNHLMSRCIFSKMMKTILKKLGGSFEELLKGKQVHLYELNLADFYKEVTESLFKLKDEYDIDVCSIMKMIHLYFSKNTDNIFKNPKISSLNSERDYRLVKTEYNTVFQTNYTQDNKRAYTLVTKDDDMLSAKMFVCPGWYVSFNYSLVECDNSMSNGLFLLWESEKREMNCFSESVEPVFRLYNSKICINRREIDEVYANWPCIHKTRKLLLIFEDELKSFSKTYDFVEAIKKITDCIIEYTTTEIQYHVDIVIATRSMPNTELCGTYVNSGLVDLVQTSLDILDLAIPLDSDFNEQKSNKILFVDGRPGIGKSYLIDALCSALFSFNFKKLSEPVFLLYSKLFNAHKRSILTRYLRRLQLVSNKDSDQPLIMERNELSAGFLYDPTRTDSKHLFDLLYSDEIFNEYKNFMKENNFCYHQLLLKDAKSNKNNDSDLEMFSNSQWCKFVNVNADDWFKRHENESFSVIRVDI